MTNRSEAYKELFLEAKGVLEGENNLIANLANLSALIQTKFNFHWTGFYLEEDGELVLGPFQGPVACTRIAFGKGVCGTAYAENKTYVVPDVHAFPGHIACSAFSNSEVVIPFECASGKGVLDIDSDKFDDFSDEDATELSKILALL